MRVEQSSSFLLDIVRSTAGGKLGLAPFQRQYAWESDDVEALMKSLLRGWPIGSVTLWTPLAEEREFLTTKGRLGPIEHPDDVRTVVLDGQNRLASLVYASRVQDAPVDPAHPYSELEREVWFGQDILTADAESRSISFMPPNEASRGRRLPLGEILDATLFNRKRLMDLYREVDDRGLSDRDFNWLTDDVTNCIRNARITITHLVDATFEEARECYMTICRAGQPISREEFDLALSYSLSATPVGKAPRP